MLTSDWICRNVLDSKCLQLETPLMENLVLDLKCPGSLADLPAAPPITAATPENKVLQRWASDLRACYCLNTAVRPECRLNRAYPTA